jgi:3-dehydroquinate dehydratase/shikimate dehydrogenase
VTHLCVPIFVTDLNQAKRDIAMAIEAGADMIELRLDHLTDAGVVQQLLAPISTLCILTCRAQWEGGESDLSDVQRVQLVHDASQTGNSCYADMELETLNRVPNARSMMPHDLIVSSHDFSGRPARLNNLVLEMNDTIGTINKIVWMARSIRDNLEVFELLKTRQKPTVALCMGEAGLISRVLAKKFGAFLTFASLRDTSATAPGQVTIHDMKRLYRWDSIIPNTKVYGVVASPVMHSMSPAIHNAAFDTTGHDGVYLPLLVEPSYESFKAFMETFLNFPGLDLSGLSITLPHKENALRYLKEKNAEIEPLAERIGAVNTIIIDRASSPSPGTPGEGRGEGFRLRGLNTDYAAILDSITDKLQITREQLSDYRVAVIGAGGTGRTAVAALAHYGATVVVYNRTKERADDLANEFNNHTGRVVSARLEKLCDSCCHIFINTTSVGMYPNIDETPLGNQSIKFTPDTLVFDTIYNPLKTKLLTQAETQGAKTIPGIEMFVRQAAAQFQAWTRQPAPTQVMRDVIVKRLSSTT